MAEILFRRWCVVIFVAIGVFVWAEKTSATQIGAQEVAITVTSGYASRYIWRGQDLFANNDSLFQQSADFSLKEIFEKTDISFNVWSGFPTQDGHELSTELDYSTSVSHDFSEFNWSGGYLYFDYPKMNDCSDVNEFWTSLSLFKIPLLPVDVSLHVFAAYECEAEHGGPEEGWYYSWGFSTELPLPECVLTQKDQSIALAITNWGNDGVAGLEPSGLYSTEYVASISYAMGRVSITPALHYVKNYIESINDENEFWAGVDLSYSF